MLSDLVSLRDKISYFDSLAEVKSSNTYYMGFRIEYKLSEVLDSTDRTSKFILDIKKIMAREVIRKMSRGHIDWDYSLNTSLYNVFTIDIRFNKSYMVESILNVRSMICEVSKVFRGILPYQLKIKRSLKEFKSVNSKNINTITLVRKDIISRKIKTESGNIPLRSIVKFAPDRVMLRDLTFSNFIFANLTIFSII